MDSRTKNQNLAKMYETYNDLYQKAKASENYEAAGFWKEKAEEVKSKIDKTNK